MRNTPEFHEAMARMYRSIDVSPKNEATLKRAKQLLFARGMDALLEKLEGKPVAEFIGKEFVTSNVKVRFSVAKLQELIDRYAAW
ncbi:hypothetical protein [Stenotrophomonas sp. PS02298]|uniref:hypothetical protein n=1 Tax=Stenotrophomonas sp. PS02298 TaxID=2991424 RepID=UPI00249AA0F0|nr:hypothetical protein [Stenotrophomonas sp. PS02298]